MAKTNPTNEQKTETGVNEAPNQAPATAQSPAKTATNELALFDNSKRALSQDDIHSIANSGVFEEEGTDVSSVVAGSEFWSERQAEELNVIFTGVSDFESDFHDEPIQAANLILVEKKDGKEVTTNLVCPNSLLTSELKKHGKGAFKISYLGKKKGKKYTYDNFRIKVLRLFV